MLELKKIGEHAVHDGFFDVNRPNGHPVYLLLLVQSQAVFLINGKWTTVLPGTAFVFKPGQQHRYHALDENYIDDWAHIEADYPLLGDKFPYGEPIILHNEEDYYNLFHMICSEYYDMGKNMIMHHLLLALLQKLQLENDSLNLPGIYYDLKKVREEIYRHPEIEWKISEITQKLNISSGYFQSLYQKLFQTTCIRDVIDSRMEMAIELLQSTNKSVSEIAEQSGYRNVEHFIRQFKKKTGTTPGKYRKKVLL